jgi:hypothetical protein
MPLLGRTPPPGTPSLGRTPLPGWTPLARLDVGRFSPGWTPSLGMPSPGQTSLLGMPHSGRTLCARACFAGAHTPHFVGRPHTRSSAYLHHTKTNPGRSRHASPGPVDERQCSNTILVFLFAD